MKHVLTLFLFACSCVMSGQPDYPLHIERYTAAQEGLTTYRFYVQLSDPTDRMSAVYAFNTAPMTINSPEGAYNTALNSSWNASGINPAFLPVFPELADDTYATIGLEGPAALSGIPNAADPSIVEDPAQPISPYFTTDGATSVLSNTVTGASWYIPNTAGNGFPDSYLRVLILQITTAGGVSGTLNYRVFPLEVETNVVDVSSDFNELPLYVQGCTDINSCTYNPEATLDDGSCEYAVENLDCDGNCIVEVDCNGECGGGDTEDALGVCGGACEADEDGDGVCDDIDDCVGSLDGCGVCNGDGTTCTGCADPAASNYDANNIFADNGQCVYSTTFNVDMTCAPEFDNVFVTGPFCGWCANDDYNTMTDDDGDGVYTVVVEGLATGGTVEYKYAVNGFAGQENLINDMVDGADCAPVTDFAGYANRQTQVGSTTNDHYGTCDGTCNDVYGAIVTFQVNMAGYAGTFGTVNLNGSFNGWCGGCAVMTDDDGDGIYSLEVSLDGGTVEYKFTVDGWTDYEMFDEGTACTSTIDGYTNRTLYVTGDQVLDAVCWNSCDTNCPVYGCTNPTACNYDDVALEDDGSCLALDECGVCGGSGIAEGYCDCQGNVPDALGVCGGTCVEDNDGNGTCDNEEVYGCSYDAASNFNPQATRDDGSCEFPCEDVVEPESCNLTYDGSGDGFVGAADLLGLLGEFNQSIPDFDGDGICDALDDCVGEVDECGVCGGPGPTFAVIESIEVLYDSVYAAQIDEWFVFEVGTDTIFSYSCDPPLASCGDPVSYQGYDYATVLIGEQCWFAENLRSENYENGDAIPTVLSYSEWSSTTSGATVVYGEGDWLCEHYSPDIDACDFEQSLNEYGCLYNWYAVDDARGLCPSGWHVPTDSEWMTMEIALGMSEEEAVSLFLRGTDQGAQMKTDYGWLDGNNGTNSIGFYGTNSSGFSGLPGGVIMSGAASLFAGMSGSWWSSSFSDTTSPSAFARSLSYESDKVNRYNYVVGYGMSVRCVRDAE